MSSAVLKQLDKNILDLKNALYKNIVIYDQDHNPSDLAPLNNYKSYLMSVLQYWARLMYEGKAAAAVPVLMPTHELQKIFTDLTSWFIKNVVNSTDADLRADALYSVKRNCEKDPLYLA